MSEFKLIGNVALKNCLKLPLRNSDRPDLVAVRLFSLSLFLSVSMSFSGCVSDEDASGDWDDPFVTEETTSSAKPEIQFEGERPANRPSGEDTPAETPQIDDELDVSTEPWEPDTGIGSKIYEEDLPFDGGSMADGAEVEQTPFSDAFEPNAGYQEEDALVRKPVSSPRINIDGSEYWVSAYKLNIRGKPSNRSKIVGRLVKSERVVVVSKSSGWAKIGHKQYVRTRYLSNRRP